VNSSEPNTNFGTYFAAAYSTHIRSTKVTRAGPLPSRYGTATFPLHMSTLTDCTERVSQIFLATKDLGTRRVGHGQGQPRTGLVRSISVKRYLGKNEVRVSEK
jgi:hypothetical protein